MNIKWAQHLCFVHGFSSKNTAIGKAVELIWKEDFIAHTSPHENSLKCVKCTWQVSSQIQSLTEFISWKFK